MKNTERALYVVSIVAMIVALLSVNRTNAQLESGLEGASADAEATVTSSNGRKP